MTTSRLKLYYRMTRPRVIFMVGVTAAWGYIIALAPHGLAGLPWSHLFATLIGTMLAAAGGTVLNGYLERDVDALMERTRNRPLPCGAVDPLHALNFGIYLVTAGLLLLLWRVSLIVAFLVLLANFIYVLVYTPMKRLSAWNTTIGAIPGAIPPMVGWVAVRGYVGIEAWMLFALLFVWQHPHVYAIAWMYRDQYSRAGFRMLSRDDASGRRTAWAVVTGCIVMLATAAWPTAEGLLGIPYFFTTAAVGTVILILGRRLALQRTIDAARTLMRATVIYLPLLLASALVDILL